MKIKSRNLTHNVLLVIISVGVWVLVLQNFGLIPQVKDQVVYVAGGVIDANVNGNVGINGRVEIGNTVDVNIHKINGYNNVTTASGTHSIFPYGYMLPIVNW